MSTPRARRFLIIPALMGLALGALALGAPSAAAPIAVDDEDRAYSAPVNGLAQCNGGVQEATVSHLNDAPWTFGETPNPIILPGSAIPVVVPNGDSDLIEVTFDAEARLDGQDAGVATPADFMRIVVFINGVQLAPDNDAMFTTDVGESVATQACRRLGPGNYVVSVGFQLIDQAGANALVGTVDDWLSRVQITD